MQRFNKLNTLFTIVVVLWTNDPFDHLPSANRLSNTLSDTYTHRYTSENNTDIPLLKKSLLTSMELQGIWRYNNRFKAMISNKIVETNSTINGYHVQHIESDRVLLLHTKSGKKNQLRMGH